MVADEKQKQYVTLKLAYGLIAVATSYCFIAAQVFGFVIVGVGGTVVIWIVIDVTDPFKRIVRAGALATRCIVMSIIGTYSIELPIAFIHSRIPSAFFGLDPLNVFVVCTIEILGLVPIFCFISAVLQAIDVYSKDLT